MYIDKYGLTNSKIDEEGAENSILWTLEHILLERMNGDTSSEARMSSLKRSIEECRIGQGLYMQNPSHVQIPSKTGKDAYMSPDQLITIMLVSKMEEMSAHKEIFLKILKQGGVRYNNLEDSKIRLIHPRDLVLYISLNIPLIGSLLLPVLGVACIIACMSKRESTSGKLLAWTKIEMLNSKYISMRITGRICDYFIKKTHGSWADVFAIYFNSENHPIKELAQEVYSD